MSSPTGGRVTRPAGIVIVALLVCVGIAVFAAGSAHGAYYKMVACSGSNGIPSPGLSINTNTRSSNYPAGIFHLWNFCDGQGGDPPGDGSFIRIQEHKVGGEAGNTAYGHLYMRAPSSVSFKTVGVYTRQPDYFNSGWRARVWIGSPYSTAQIISVGKGLSNNGGQGSPTNGFVGRPWPLEVFYDFDTVVFEMTCARSSGCSTDGKNTADFNGLDFIMEDDHKAKAEFTKTHTDFLSGKWVKGWHVGTYKSSDVGTGIRRERARIDGAEHWVYTPSCSISSSARSGEWARKYQPCNDGPHNRSFPVETRDLSDGSHTLAACTQDFAQYQGLYGSGSESCAKRTIRTDNTAPGKPAGLEVTSENPERYLSRFGAKWSLPPDPGSPIKKVHYEVIDSRGHVVVPEKTLGGTNPTELAEFDGPQEPGAYRIRVWFEDEVGFLGPAAIAKVPRDTKPPAAPQDLTAAPPSTPRSLDGFDVRWRNIEDSGSPIVAAHYRIKDGRGATVVGEKTVSQRNPESVENLDTPRRQGHYSLSVWLSDAEGNVGAPAKIPLSYSCVRSWSRGGRTLTAGLGEGAGPAAVVKQGEGSTLRGGLYGHRGGIPNAPLCIYSRIVTDQAPEFLGLAMTGADGAYQFPVGAGPSRVVTAIYRPGQRELTARALLQTKVRPTFRLRRNVVRNKGVARFFGCIPGPNAENVVVVLQVKSGKAWRVFRRVRPWSNGCYRMRYRFTQTPRPTVYIMRAQIRATGGYPYLRGNSRARRVRVVPSASRARRLLRASVDRGRTVNG
jgi:hypothetical protein